MENTIYLVVCKGHPQTLWFRTLAKAKEYCQEYGGDNYSIHEYSLKGEIERTEPKPLYKKFW